MVFKLWKLIEKIGLYRPIKCRLYLISLTSIFSLQVHSFFRARLGQIKLFSGPYERAHSDWFHFQTHLFKMDFQDVQKPKIFKNAKIFENWNEVGKLKFFDDEIFGSKIEFNLSIIARLERK